MTIGIVNINLLLDESPQGQSLSGRLSKSVQDWEEQLRTIQSALAQIDSKIAKTPDSALDEVRFKLLRDKELGQMEMRQIEERMRLDIESQRTQFRNQLLSDLEPVIAAVAKEQDIDVILHSPHPALAYARPNLDVTSDVLKHLNSTTIQKR